MTIVIDTSTINVIDDASLALASIVNCDRKWRYNLERHFDDTRSVNYDRNTFIIQATGCQWPRVNIHPTTSEKGPNPVDREVKLSKVNNNCD